MSWGGREAHPDVRKWSEGPPECPGVVGRPYRKSGSGREALPGGRNALLMSGSGREALADVQEWSGGPPGCMGVGGRPSGWSECSADVREWSGGPP